MYNIIMISLGVIILKSESVLFYDFLFLPEVILVGKKGCPARAGIEYCMLELCRLPHTPDTRHWPSKTSSLNKLNNGIL